MVAVPAASDLASVAARSRAAYAARVAGDGAVPWWTAVVLTAGSLRQAERYQEEVQRRRREGKIPAGVLYLAAPDPDGERIGSGGATLNALRVLAEHSPAASGPAWWSAQRVLVLHSGGDARRLPQYSLLGKLFSALPVKTPWGEVSTLFDELLALSTAWAERLPAGLVVGSGDVLLTFDAAQLNWTRPGVCGVAMRQPVQIGSQHGVYVLDEQARVYAFLQKPTPSQARAAGGLMPNQTVAVDTGLLRFDPLLAARLTQAALAAETGLGPDAPSRPCFDLYEHVMLMLTGQWSPGREAHPALHRAAGVLKGAPLWCDLVEGDFTHVGATPLYRRLLTEETPFLKLYDARERVGASAPPGLRSAGTIIDSVLAQGELKPGAVVLECELEGPVRAGRGAVLHGLSGLPGPIEVPEDTVLHQMPIVLPDGRRGTVLRVYGVHDDPKRSLAATPPATWLNQPMAEVLAGLGLEAEDVWPGVPAAERSLWNARLFPFGAPEAAWKCARWMLGFPEDYDAARWRAAERLSLAASAQWADTRELADARSRRMQANWRVTAVSLAQSGADVRPLLANPPGIAALAAAGRDLAACAAGLEAEALTEAASRYFQAGLFLAHAGLAEEAERARAAAFDCVRRAVEAGVRDIRLELGAGRWQGASVSVSAPPRIDLGGGWSDTPPFCLDWGGAVLNIALELEGDYPIRTVVRRLEEPVVRCISEEAGRTAEFRSARELSAPPSPGSPFSIPRVALEMFGVVRPGRSLPETLRELGGGVEIRTVVDLPMGSGLGASSILAATVLRALAEMLGIALSDQALSDQVMRLEQLMTTGGGWQDQAGGIFPGAKLVLSGPGLRQRLRIEPLAWSEARQAEFAERFVLYYTGIRRIAKDLLSQVVGAYLAREVAVIQVLHSIKTLALEMAYAMREGEWERLGRLIDRHWRLNQILDPHTTNAPINALLEEARPHLAGAKLAGAGGGGFLLLLARSPEDARALRRKLAARAGPGALYRYRIASRGLRVSG